MPGKPSQRRRCSSEVHPNDVCGQTLERYMVRKGKGMRRSVTLLLCPKCDYPTPILKARRE